jgi:succinoglycan biosynthesis protein ExoM
VSEPHITICICTFRRVALLARLLERLTEQEAEGLFTFSIAVCDNDATQSAASVVSSFQQRTAIEITYVWEPRQNIARARNKVLEAARGEFIAFIDDDEFPAGDWLLNLSKALVRHRSSGVLGPVRPHFDEPPPFWIVKGRFCERPEYKTGRIMKWDESRTGNVLFLRSILEGVSEPFKPEFGTGGEDKDFFMQMTRRGFVFIWCNEAIVYETVPPSRWTRSYMLKRALLRGRNILKHPQGRMDALAKSLVALPVYSLVLPFTLLFGQQCFMKYCIKFCDHLGRFLALLNVNRIERHV